MIALLAGFLLTLLLTKGDHIWSLNCTDTVTGWTETLSIKKQFSSNVKAGHEELLPRFPFNIKGINYDGDSEFINREMIDNSHVEQKNFDIIRRNAKKPSYSK